MFCWRKVEEEVGLDECLGGGVEPCYVVVGETGEVALRGDVRAQVVISLKSQEHTYQDSI